MELRPCTLRNSSFESKKCEVGEYGEIRIIHPFVLEKIKVENGRVLDESKDDFVAACDAYICHHAEFRCANYQKSVLYKLYMSQEPSPWMQQQSQIPSSMRCHVGFIFKAKRNTKTCNEEMAMYRSLFWYQVQER